MTNRNINTMDFIVDKLAEGNTISQALKCTYEKRYVQIPFNEKSMSVYVTDLDLSNRTINALLRTKLRTLKDVIEYCNDKKITSIKNLGVNSGVELFEVILDWCWEHLDKTEKKDFLIQTVVINDFNLKTELAKQF